MLQLCFGKHERGKDLMYFNEFIFSLEFSYKKSWANRSYTGTQNVWFDVRSRFMADQGEIGGRMSRTMFQMATNPQQFRCVLLCHHTGLFRKGIDTYNHNLLIFPKRCLIHQSQRLLLLALVIPLIANMCKFHWTVWINPASKNTLASVLANFAIRHQIWIGIHFG